MKNQSDVQWNNSREPYNSPSTESSGHRDVESGSVRSPRPINGSRDPTRAYIHSISRSVGSYLSFQQQSSSVREHTAELASLALENSDLDDEPDNVGQETLEASSNDVHPVTSSPNPKTEQKQIALPEENNGLKKKPSSSLTSMLKQRQSLSIPEDQKPPRTSSPSSPSGEASSERTGLLQSGKPDNDSQSPDRYGSTLVLTPVASTPSSHGSVAVARPSTLLYPSSAKPNPGLWEKVKGDFPISKFFRYLPPVALGVLLNILDGLSYGLILFPLGVPLFESLGPVGLSMFYISCIVSQLVISLGGSAFKAGIGSEMIEVVPFFHTMAYSLLREIGDDKPKAVIATTLVAYSSSAIVTGAVFFCLGGLHLGRLIGFFPRHILVGCIGGVGWFLVDTGVQVSARFEGSFNYNWITLKHLFELHTLPLWIVPLLLAITLVTIQNYWHSSLAVPGFFGAVFILFYLFVLIIPGATIEGARQAGWIFAAPSYNFPWYHFYTLYDFSLVDWKALGSTIPAMFALTFFGILHVPINVPALAVSTGEDYIDVDRELVSHGVSNALSGLLGSIQNYLVYTNSLLFIRSGADSRLAGVMLAAATAGVMMAGPALIGYIPVMVVGALIYLLGIELLREALYDTSGKVTKLEYGTIVAIIVTMGAWDFVYGILVGIILACVSFVVQASTIPAIRAQYTGAVARSTVRRHIVQQRFLQRVGRQIYVCKLAGYVFFGTIVGVENTVKHLIEEARFEKSPIRFLIMDLFMVSGIDFSAAESFTRMKRLLKAKDVQLLFCGAHQNTDVWRALTAVGLWEDEEPNTDLKDTDSEDTQCVVGQFEDLNMALEWCENFFLEGYYRQRDAYIAKQRQSKGVPIAEGTSKQQSQIASDSGIVGTPRVTLLNEAANETVSKHPQLHTRWHNYKQPLPLILQAFYEISTENEEFWYQAVPFFKRQELKKDQVLFKQNDLAIAFYILESGLLKADYDLIPGHLSENIVAGTTCGELPFFTETTRTATVTAELDSIVWKLDQENWKSLQESKPNGTLVANELLKVALKLTSERLTAITRYIMVKAN